MGSKVPTKPTAKDIANQLPRHMLPPAPPLPNEGLAAYRKRCGWTEPKTIFGTAEEVEAMLKEALE